MTLGDQQSLIAAARLRLRRQIIKDAKRERGEGLRCIPLTNSEVKERIAERYVADEAKVIQLLTSVGSVPGGIFRRLAITRGVASAVPD